MSTERTFGFLAAGAGVGSFEVRRLLGVKPTGVTYLAFDRDLRQDAVIRVIAAWDDADVPTGGLNLIEQVHRLVSLTREVDHVLAFYDHGFTEIETLGERPYLVRYYAQQNLSTVLRSPRRMSESQVIKVALHASDGLCALHDFGLVHADVRPANVFRIGHSGRWALADYGLLDLVGVAPRESYFTSPDREYTAGSDVYSYGRLVEVLLREVPPEPRLSTGGAERSFVRELNEIAAACTHRDPARRPTARSVRLTLERGLAVVVADVNLLLLSDAVRANAIRRLLERSAVRGAALKPRRAELAVNAAAHALARRVEGSHGEACRLLEPDHAVTQLLNVSEIFLGRGLSASEIDELADEDLLGEPEPSSEELAREAVLDQGWLQHIRHTMDGLVVASRAAARDRHMPDRLKKRFVLSEQDIVERYDRALRHATEVRRELLREPTVPWKAVVRLLEEKGAVSEEQLSEMFELGCLVVLDAADEALVPAFQFDWENGCPRPVVGKVNQVLDARQDPWSALAWWYAPNPYLDDRAPASVVGEPTRRLRLLRAALVAASPAA